VSVRRWSETQLRAVEVAVSKTSVAVADGFDAVMRLPDPPRSRWHRAGVTPRGERVFNVAAGVVVLTLMAGWTWAIAQASGEGADSGGQAAASISSALTDPNAPSAAFLTEAALRAFTPLRGRSGRLRASIGAPGAAIQADTMLFGAHIEIATGDTIDSLAPLLAPKQAGVWQAVVKVGSAIKPVTDFSVITLKPFSDKRRGRIGLYYLGNWPTEGGKVRARGYVTPSGFIEVTEENQDTWVSDHFRLRDFLTKGQGNVWPKYLVLDTKLIDKLELVLSELEMDGIPASSVRVMSGFRTPSYNEAGGDPSGRAALSRHMYGDAADIYMDRDGNGSMDDLNGDRRVNMRDIGVIEAAVDRVERAYPALLGGTGVYPGSASHGPFIHIDTRGFRARWTGTGDD
jgi:hypothetical protein